ncbi:MAG TPA: photosynthetic reaction center cytochrome c subunit family protein [Thermoanaerobaculia bacterium]|nr:photosynthetic reaction center cytochrome c subunit family protein [Thermoanaerobaculia bacterium]
MRAHVILGTAVLLLFATGAAPAADDPQVTELLAAIKGKENRPAGEVFKNVTLLKDVPAARFLRMMDVGYSQSLGIGCDHCHVEDRWEADEKRPKRAAREMIILVKEINARLGEMQEIDTSDAVVNCTTCHRGYVKPALQMR